MKRQISRVTVSSMTDRRVDSVPLTQRPVKNALSSVQRWCSRLRREVVHRDDKAGKQSFVNKVGSKLRAPRMQLDEEELWNLNNENLENELRELAANMKLT